MTAATAVTELIGTQLGYPSRSLMECADLRELGASDADVIEIMFAIEDRWGLAITDAERERWRTVGDVIATTNGHLADCE